MRQALEAKRDLFFEIRQPQSGSFFFRRYGLLYLSVDEVKQSTDLLIRERCRLTGAYEERSMHCPSPLWEYDAMSSGSTI
jgi:hypothetical protein